MVGDILMAELIGSFLGILLVVFLSFKLSYKILFNGFRITNKKPDEFHENLVKEAFPYVIANTIIVIILMLSLGYIDSFEEVNTFLIFVFISGISFILSSYLVMVDFKLLLLINVLIDDKNKKLILKSVKVAQIVLLISALTYQLCTKQFSNTVVLFTLLPILLIMMVITVILIACLIYQNVIKSSKID